MTTPFCNTRFDFGNKFHYKKRRKTCYELTERVLVGGLPKITGKEREMDIVYKVDIASVLHYKLKKQKKVYGFTTIHTLFC